MKLQILVIDSEPIFCESFAGLLRSMPMIAKSSWASSISSIHLVDRNSIDIVFINPSFEENTTVSYLNALTALFPISKIIILTSCEGKSIVEFWLRAGVGGYLTKSVGIQELEKALRALSNNERYVQEKIGKVLEQSFYNLEGAATVQLSIQENKLSRLLVKGLTSKEIADHMCLSIKTINSYRESLLKKTKCKNVAELVSFLYRNGILRVNGEHVA